ICMHGSPLSPFDNRSLWEWYDYRSYGILGEPYFDLDRSHFLYLTDTGRRWDGDRFSVRDRMETSFSCILRNTGDIIRELQNESLPGKIMFTFHPQRWNSHPVPWIRELVLQAFKNLIKKRFFVKRN
ncbi:MAG: hypothetical protein JW861_04135, partial [Bacteroidales bacterium]|nr:hypothetical protein [Bacteroidales bacterium]